MCLCSLDHVGCDDGVCNVVIPHECAKDVVECQSNSHMIAITNMIIERPMFPYVMQLCSIGTKRGSSYLDSPNVIEGGDHKIMPNLGVEQAN